MTPLQFQHLTNAELANAPSPFIKWAGGKSQLLPQLAKFFPNDIPNYIEPFIGGGAVFFHLRSQGKLTGRVTLADVNHELINAYRSVQRDVVSVLNELWKHRKAHCKEYFYDVRSQPSTEDVKGAARTIYLNKTAFNGLYRVNKKGQFNVPIGSYKNPAIYDEIGLRKASFALQGVNLVVQSYDQTLANLENDAFVYLDPPYVPLSITSSFTAYSPGGFGIQDQERLARCVVQVHESGGRFVLSNSYTNVVCTLYEQFCIAKVSAKRMINSNAEKRGEIDEAVVYNFDIGITRGNLNGRTRNRSKKRG